MLGQRLLCCEPGDLPDRVPRLPGHLPTAVGAAVAAVPTVPTVSAPSTAATVPAPSTAAVAAAIAARALL